MTSLRPLRLLCLFAALSCLARADDGYRLWLRYDRITDLSREELAAYSGAVAELHFVTPTGRESLTIEAARREAHGIDEMVSFGPEVGLLAGEVPASLGEEGYSLKQQGSRVTISARTDIGILYGTFDLVRRIQMRRPLVGIDVTSKPRIQRRLLNHWDNLNGTVARGYAGGSLWNWFTLPDHVDARITDYARACASVGINGAVLTNVNANARFLTPQMLEKTAALAATLRTYGIRVYLTARFSAPVEIGGLKTADPLDPGVRAWWAKKADEIYGYIPDFGGFLVKANSEGQPGPQDYQRTHADGANMMADALAPHGGIVMWRAFVYSHEAPDDRAKQGHQEFAPLDGTFRPNVVVQVKNGPIDFMPREPVHPLFGAMPKTPLSLELQISQEYLGCSTQLAFLAPLFEEVLDTDTHANGIGTTVGRIIDGSADGHTLSVIAGVANTGNDRNWTGHPLAQSNWYAFGRLAWDHTLDSATIADEWTRLTFGNDAKVVQSIAHMLMESREAVVNYSMPLGLHHIMAEGHHYGPGPWVADLPRADWTSVYYHRATEDGVGFDRTATGSNALALHAPEFAKFYGHLATCPDEFLLWFHHLPWDHTMRSGRTLWDEIALHYQRGVDSVRSWQKTWAGLRGSIDPEQFAHVESLLRIQEREARHWRDACLLYFQTFAKRPLPAGVEPPEHDLEYYKNYQPAYVPGRDGA